MSLYWPEANVAIEIVDDPASEPFDRASYPNVTVIPVTCAQISDATAFEGIATILAARLGADPPAQDSESRARRAALHRTLFGPPRS